MQLKTAPQEKLRALAVIPLCAGSGRNGARVRTDGSAVYRLGVLVQ